jgi:transposase
MIRKKKKSEQTSMWISTDELQVKPQMTFFAKLNSILDKIKFGDQVRKLCNPYYCDRDNCRPPVDPEIHFKMLMIGFFESITSDRGIASRCADSISIRDFLGYKINEKTPEHSNFTDTRNRLPESVYHKVFAIITKALMEHGLIKGQNLALDTSVIEANASLFKLQNRMTDECYSKYIRDLAEQSGVNPEDKAAVARFDRKREGRKTSNKEWYNPYDPDAKIGQTKDGATDMIYKCEHVVDLDTGAIVNADILLGDTGDTNQLSERVVEAQIRLIDISDNPIEDEPVETITADKGYYNVQEITTIQCFGIETNIPDKGFKRNMSKLCDEKALAVELAHSSVSSAEGKALLKKRGSNVERSFAHVLDCGGGRRTTLKGEEKNRKRYLILAACYNLSLLMRTIFGFGTLKQFVANSNSGLNFILNLLSGLTKRISVVFRLLFFLKCQRTIIFKYH